MSSGSKGEKQLTNCIADLRQRLALAEGLFRQCEQRASDPGGVDFAPLALFLHIMQMGDGILILAEAMSSAPMFPLLRSMVESHFSLEYIIGKESNSRDHEKRSLAWLVFCINQDIALQDMIDPVHYTRRHFQGGIKGRLWFHWPGDMQPSRPSALPPPALDRCMNDLENPISSFCRRSIRSSNLVTFFN